MGLVSSSLSGHSSISLNSNPCLTEQKEAGLEDTNQVTVQDFEFLKMLGKAKYGKVYLVRKSSGSDQGSVYTMKVLSKADVIADRQATEQTIKERQLLEAVKGKSFLPDLQYAFQTDSDLYLVTDCNPGGKLSNLLKKDTSENTVKFYMAELILTIESLHSLGIMCRDIKPENVLLGADGHLIVADFGRIKQLPVNDPNARDYSLCGTIEFMAPEMLVPGGGHEYACDVWSIAVLSYELLTGALPFGTVAATGKYRVRRSIMESAPSYPEHLSCDAKDLLQKMLKKDPLERLGGPSYGGIQALKEHPFFDDIDWGKVARRELTPPFVPPPSSAADSSNCGAEFIKQPVSGFTAAAPTTSRRWFQGYSYSASTMS